MPFYIFVKYIFFSAYMIKHPESFLYSYSESSHVLNPSTLYLCGVNVNLDIYFLKLTRGEVGGDSGGEKGEGLLRNMYKGHMTKL